MLNADKINFLVSLWVFTDISWVSISRKRLLKDVLFLFSLIKLMVLCAVCVTQCNSELVVCPEEAVQSPAFC